jgi:hypothetical protein
LNNLVANTNDYFKGINDCFRGLNGSNSEHTINILELNKENTKAILDALTKQNSFLKESSKLSMALMTRITQMLCNQDKSENSDNNSSSGSDHQKAVWDQD